MTETRPDYLRIHRDPSPIQPPDPLATPDLADEFWQAFSDATGWRVQHNGSTQQRPLLLPTVDFDPMGGADQLESVPVVKRSSAQLLAQAADDLTQELTLARATLRRQEVELASRAVITNDQQREAIADALEKTLADAAAACRCEAAAMYLLDDDTKSLNTRAAYGLPPNRLEQPARELRGSRGDLEALVQGVVAIDDLHDSDIDTWNCPEPAGSAICAAINHDSVPIGTLWLYGKDANRFSSADNAAARMASTQLALQLELAKTKHNESLKKKAAELLRDIAQWQFMSLPAGTKLADGWLVDGMIESPKDWAIGWHTWDVLPDGTLMMAMAEAEDRSLAGAMAAATCRAALTAHTGYRHTARELMQRISDTLWQTNTGEQLVSLIYVRIDPETGEGEVTSAGKITAIVSSGYGYRPLADGKSPLLTSHLDSRCEISSFRMAAGEAFLAYGPGLDTGNRSQMMLGDQLRTCMQRDDPHPLAAIRRAIATIPLQHERGAISIVRQ